MENRMFLLDTHIFIWWMEENQRLSKTTYSLLNDPKNIMYVSIASIWEIILKKAKQKLKVPYGIEEGLKASRFNKLPIEIAHVLEIEKLPSHHKDPFDRLLIAQARIENLTIVTSDKKIKRYSVKVFPS